MIAELLSMIDTSILWTPTSTINFGCTINERLFVSITTNAGWVPAGYAFMEDIMTESPASGSEIDGVTVMVPISATD